MTTELNDGTASKKGRDSYSDYPSFPQYVESCFLTLQNAIEREYIKAVAESFPSVKFLGIQSVQLRRFPHPSVTVDVFTETVGPAILFLLVICLILSVKSIIKVRTKFAISATLEYLFCFSECHS